jgi:hypothetical protein
MERFFRLATWSWLNLSLLMLGSLGCQGDPPSTPSPLPQSPEAPQLRSSEAAKATESKRVPVGPNVALEIDGNHRRVLISGYVCLREGQLEQLMCLRGTKEHEAILAAAADARDMHKALLIAGAKPGAPVRYEPKFQPPSGTPIRVTLRFEKDGKVITVPAQEWVRDVRTHKSLKQDWVFAGSVLFPDPLDKDKPPLYAANSGDVICVANFEGAMLDLPINSSKDNSDLSFEAFTERIPPLETKVTIVLEPKLAQEKTK